MKQLISSTGIAARIWIGTSLAFGAAWLILVPFFGGGTWAWVTFIPAIICAAIGSLPVLLILAIVIPVIDKKQMPVKTKFAGLLLTCFICTLCYGAPGGLVFGGFYTRNWGDWIITSSVNTDSLFDCTLIPVLIIKNRNFSFFYYSQHNNFL